MSDEPVRIASLLPAATEIVGALGLAEHLVAVTFECDEPVGLRERLPVVVDTALPPDADPATIDATVRERAAAGVGLYDLDRAALRAAAPDLVLTQDLCGVCALPGRTVDEACRELGLDADVLTTVVAIGERAGAPRAAAAVVAGLSGRLDAVARAVAGRPAPRVLVLEWTDPPYLAGHWVPELVRCAGGVPVAGIEGGRSVAADPDELRRVAADVVLVAPCGFGLDDAVAQARTVAAWRPDLPTVAIDSAAYVVRAAPRLVDGVEALAWALHPGAVPEPPPGQIATAPADTTGPTGPTGPADPLIPPAAEPPVPAPPSRRPG